MVLNLVSVSVDLWINDVVLIRKRLPPSQYKIIEGMVAHSGQLGYKFMVHVHKLVMEAGRRLDWSHHALRIIDQDLQIILQTLVASILPALAQLVRSDWCVFYFIGLAHEDGSYVDRACALDQGHAGYCSHHHIVRPCGSGCCFVNHTL